MQKFIKINGKKNVLGICLQNIFASLYSAIELAFYLGKDGDYYVNEKV